MAPVGSFVAADGNVTWFYQDGKTGTRNPAGLETVSLTLEDAPVLMTPSSPVAVLVDSSTASSAEAITIAFHGRPDTRFFGTRTAGKSTAVQPFKLDDGAELYLTTAIDADRTGKAYPDGFTPDEVIPYNSSSMPLESNDAALQAAQKWLVASTTPTAPPPAPAPTPKTRGKKAPLVHQQLASTPATPPPAATAAVTPATASATPPPAPTPAPAAQATATAVTATVTAAPAPVTAAPAAATAATGCCDRRIDLRRRIAAHRLQTLRRLKWWQAATPAAPPAPAATKPKTHKKVVVHQGS